MKKKELAQALQKGKSRRYLKVFNYIIKQQKKERQHTIKLSSSSSTTCPIYSLTPFLHTFLASFFFVCTLSWLHRRCLLYFDDKFSTLHTTIAYKEYKDISISEQQIYCMKTNFCPLMVMVHGKQKER